MTKQDDMVAVVTGASRGIGRGVARALGRRGATVYVTARPRPANTSSASGLASSIESVANEVTAAGGRGIAVACDMADDQQIKGMFEKIGNESGHINILVNNAASLNDQMVVQPFWDATIDLANIIDVGLRCHHVATYCASALLRAADRALIVNISFYGNAKVHDPAYYAAKAGMDKLAAAYAEPFAPYNVAAVSLWPGFVATEKMLELASIEPDVQKMREELGFETPEFIGRVIGAIYDDPEIASLSGKTLLTAEMGNRYGITDIDGSAPKSLRELYGGPHPSLDIFGRIEELR
jgi:NAD(P)-dependent dehydrogenase (short-subunit alcohol dehydrogenase family)